MDFIYWVVSRDCNQACPHCYNNSEPGAPGLSFSEVEQVVANLPDLAEAPVDHVMLSGGEVLVWPELLLFTLERLYAKFGDRTELTVQTNGDLLDEPMLHRLLDHHVTRIDVSSQDAYHKAISRKRRPELEAMFKANGIEVLKDMPGWLPVGERKRTAAFWGATQDAWIGPLWPRGRGMSNGLSRATSADKFCALWSGGRKFLDYNAPRGHGNEVSIQLADLYPCCQMTCRPLGDLREQRLIDILDRCALEPVFQAINAGEPERMGESLGLSHAYGLERSEALGNHCLWCDEFFEKHAPQLLHHTPTVTTRGLVDVTIALKPQSTRHAKASADVRAGVAGVIAE